MSSGLALTSITGHAAAQTSGRAIMQRKTLPCVPAFGNMLLSSCPMLRLGTSHIRRIVRQR
jgi:hypothetical protein